MLKTITGLVKSKLAKRKVDKRVFEHFSLQLTPSAIAGEKNYNIERRILKGFVKNGDIEGAKNYVSQQQDKLRKQKQEKQIKTLYERGSF